MPASITSKDNATVAEVGLGAPAARGEADEAELARMGYKQELKYVSFLFFSLGVVL